MWSGDFTIDIQDAIDKLGHSAVYVHCLCLMILDTLTCSLLFFQSNFINFVDFDLNWEIVL